MREFAQHCGIDTHTHTSGTSMDFEEYRIRGKEMVDYVADYLTNIRSRRVFPNVSPGYMRHLVPDEAPEDGERWDSIFSDVERVIMPGMTHWQSPYMHAYFPALNSCPSLLGDMLADAIGCLGFTWASSPAATELETIVMDWLGKMIGLPSEFLHSSEQTMGGGVIQTTASESTFVALLAARTEAIRRYKGDKSNIEEAAEVNARLVAYCSDQAHSSVEKAGLIGLVQLRLVESDDNLSMRGDALRDAVQQDIKKGLIPFFVCATLGTTGACAFDNLLEIGPICRDKDIWLHIDAAYAGTAFICPEFRHFMAGVDYAHSFAFNPSKWMMVHFDCTAMWLKNAGALHRTFNVQPLYLRHENTGAAIDYMHWQVPLSKRFRALKLWFVIRSFGITGLQKHIRHGVALAEKFEELVLKDDRFEIPAARYLGMVVFRLKGTDELTEALLKKVNSSGQLHCVPASLKGKYVIRFTVTSQYTTLEDIERDWSIIDMWASKILDEAQEAAEAEDEETGVEQGTKGMTLEDVEEQVEEQDEGNSVPVILNKVDNNKNISDSGRLKREGLKMKKKDFGMSLVLSNVPMSPKFINGSFVALFDDNNDEILVDYAKHLGSKSFDFNGQPIRLSPRKRLRDQPKQYSFDMSLTPTPRTAYMPTKQGSLDSKIEELFESRHASFDSTAEDGENGHDKTSTAASPFPAKCRVCEHCGSRLAENGKPE